MKTKVVILPITVPEGDLCWDFNSDEIPICSYYNNSGGDSRCRFFGHLKKHSIIPEGGLGYDGFLKPDQCLELKDQ